MSIVDGYLSAAERAVALLESPEVAAAWERPSALPEMSVGALSGHLAHQLFSVDAALRTCGDPGSRQSRETPIPLLDHYTRATWIGAPPDAEVNVGIRAKGEEIAAQGAPRLTELARTTLAGQRTTLAGYSGEEVAFLPERGWALRLDDFLVTRMLELAVHQDDLAVSAGLPTPELPASAFDPVVALLTRLAARRHGRTALLRALSRAERAPAAINAM
ncbi:maleylpyruvate isomerase N-terminal domain-containing protein [Streptomyces zingiberis]|uniref:Mycothiol-dependent maleylpyruvate isomerase metal-binding domain-containing protein n=1 Tax=Streptomyces zingiberis TaxID=2053010 RepID=A0ABX1BXY7_9ACTN|nr:maleylpyruvate isomerase N-terminal domain-containing protein [Streptomyces zingiberis]NJQ01288.1 hypothetical protein [Streptomyces zingiberis]